MNDSRITRLLTPRLVAVIGTALTLLLCAGGYHADTVSLAFLLILPGGLLLTGLSATWLRQQLHSQERVEILVNERTIELALANSRLSSEIDDHCRTVEALALSRNHMRTILDNLPMMAWLKDREGRFLLVNQQFIEAAGRPREEILGLTTFDVWPHDLAEYYHTVDEEIIATGRSRQVIEEIADF